MDIYQSEINTENEDVPVMQNQLINPRPILPIIIISLVSGAAIMAGGIFGYQYLTANKSIVNEVSIPMNSATPTPLSQTSLMENDWKNYTNTKYRFSLKIPSNWINYSMKDFSPIEFTNTENSLYLGPKNSRQTPPQLIQITAYLKDKYQAKEVYQNCRKENIVVGLYQTPATRTQCDSLETNGYITVSSYQYVFIIDELLGTPQDHELFEEILASMEFDDQNIVEDEDKVSKIVQQLIATESKVSTEKVKIESIDVQGNFASGASRLIIDEEGGPGGGFIAAKVDNQWKIVEQFQEPPSCKLMRQYSVPVSVYKGCLEK